MSFIKKFEFKKEEGLVLINIVDKERYLNEKIDLFLKDGNYTSKEALLSLLKDILAMYEYDLEEATFDTKEVDHFRLFDIKDYKDRFIAYYDMVVMLGSIALHVFDAPPNRVVRVDDGINGPVSTEQMFNRAYQELILCKSYNIPPYGANLIFATLLEKDLKTVIKREYVKDWLKELQNKIKSGSITFLTEADKELFTYLLFEYEVETSRSPIVYDSVKATTEGLYDLLLKYNIINEDKGKNKEKLVKNKYTLNQFLQSEFSSKIEPPYLKVIKILFGNDNLNLRNDLAHCNFGYFNYHTITVGSLLYLLFDMLSNKYAIK